jgi:hypothetical protein
MSVIEHVVPLAERDSDCPPVYAVESISAANENEPVSI